MSKELTYSVSSPGKVLICGGYVVLHGADALVISTTSRFYSEISAAVADGKNTSLTINVESPQFECTYQYKLHYNRDDGSMYDTFYYINI